MACEPHLWLVRTNRRIEGAPIIAWAGERVAHVVSTRLTDIVLAGIDPIVRIAGKRFG
jgi:hypothetical protein